MPTPQVTAASLALCALAGCTMQPPNGVFACVSATECPGGFSCWSDGRCYDSEELPEQTDFDAACGQVVTKNGATVTLREDLLCEEPIALKVEASDVVVDLNGYTIRSAGGGTNGILVDGSDVVVTGTPSAGSSAGLEGRLHSRIEGFVIGILFRQTIGGTISSVWVRDCETGFSLSGGTRNVTLSDIGATDPSFAGVVVRNDSEQNEVIRFEQEGGNVGVNVEQSDDTLVEQCDIRGTEQHGIMVGLLPFDGMDLPRRTLVRDNVIANTGGNGIVARGEADVLIENNQISDAGKWGIKAPGALLDGNPLGNEVRNSGELAQCEPLELCL